MPYQPPAQARNESEPEIDCDLQAMLQEFKNANDDQDLLVASAQYETQNVKASKAVMKKNENPKMLQHTFQNCTFGNIGSINIHIHKN